jgi:hypothetical protein
MNKVDISSSLWAPFLSNPPKTARPTLHAKGGTEHERLVMDYLATDLLEVASNVTRIGGRNIVKKERPRRRDP